MSAAPLVIAVIARASNGVIGRDNRLPWHLPADLKRFKALTLGSVMIMGRRTFDSLPGLLPGRRHVVLTRDSAWTSPGAEVAHDVDSAFGLAGNAPVSVIGGAQIFALCLPRTRRIELTEVLAQIEGDTSLADPRDTGDWREVSRQDHPVADGRPAFRFVTLDRV